MCNYIKIYVVSLTFFLGGIFFCVVPEMSKWLVFIPVLVVLAFAFLFQRDFFSLQPYLLLVVPYLALNFGFLWSVGADISKLAILVCLGMLVFSFSYFFVRRCVDSGFFIFSVNQPYCMRVLIFVSSALLLLKFWLNSGVVGPLAVAFNLVVRPSLEFLMAGAVFALLSTAGVGLALVLISIVVGYLALFALLSNDVSRMSFFQYFLMVGIVIFYRLRGFKCFKIDLLTLLLLILCSIFLSVMVVLAGITSGGDSFLYLNALQAIEEVDRQGKFHPLMPLHNGFAILIPDFFWLSEKPKGYTTNGWFLQHVLNLDPSEHPWGVGITSFGAGYLYGGYWGVIVLFFFYGITAALFRGVARNPFMLGVLVIFNIKLLFCIFRMDESMLMGAILPSFLFLFLIYRMVRFRVIRIEGYSSVPLEGRYAGKT